MIAALRSYLSDNPVLVKELRVRMRGARAYWILFGYLGILAFVLFIQYTTWYNDVLARGGTSGGSKIGQQFFTWLTTTQAFLVAFITPAVTSGAITIEKEQQTLEMLMMSRLTSGRIVAGKLLSAVGFIALLLVSSLPITSICFFLGGVSPEKVFLVYVILLASSFVAGALGLVWSTISKTTAAAVVMTFLTLLLPVFVFGVLFSTVGAASGVRNGANVGIATLLSIMSVFASVGDSLSVVGISSSSAPGMMRYYGLSMPEWIAPALTYALIGTTLAAVAAVRLDPFPDRKGWLLRALVAAFILQQTFFVVGAQLSSSPAIGFLTTQRLPTITSLIYPALLILFAIPVFATGELGNSDPRPLGKIFLGGLRVKEIFQGKLSSGMPFLLLLVLGVMAIYAVGNVVAGNASALTKPVPVVVVQVTQPFMTPPSSPNGTTPTFAPPVAPQVTGYKSAGVLETTLLLLVTVVGLSGVGFLFSVWTRNRWASLGLTLAALFMILLAPVVAMVGYSMNRNAGVGILANLFYLNPVFSLLEIGDNTGTFWSDFPLIGQGGTPWIVSVVLWLIIAAFTLGVASMIHGRRVGSTA